MFTGIVEEVGTMQSVSKRDDVHHYQILAPCEFISGIQIGDSISVNGVCLTAKKIDSKSFHVDVSTETQNCTTLGHLNRSKFVNLERAVTPSTRLGGHLVSGHIDGLGILDKRVDNTNETLLWTKSPANLLKYIAVKGSICLNGVSLTVNEVSGDSHCVTIIPHTLENTTLGSLEVGDEMNIEVDLIARYLEQLINSKN